MKIAFVTQNANFLMPLESEFSRDHEVIGLFGWNNDTTQFLRLQHLLMTSDVVFFDFINTPLFVSLGLFHSAKLVVRMHGIEIFHYFQKVNWNKVSLLITSPPQARRVHEMVDVMPSKVLELPIGTNLDLFKPQGHVNRVPQVCMVGNILPHKGHYSALQALAPLLRAGLCHFNIHGQTLPGAWRDDIKRETVFALRELIAMQHLEKHVTWTEPQELPDYANWLATQDVIISNSSYEGYHKVVFDAMASGVYPLVNLWYGAELLYPHANLYSNLVEMLQKLQTWLGASIPSRNARLKNLREYVELNHDEKKVARQIREEVECLVK